MKININELWAEIKDYTNQMIELKNRTKITDEELSKQRKEIFENISDRFTHIISFIRQHLVLAYDKFYGTVLLDVDMKISDDIEGAIDTKFGNNNIEMLLNPLFMGNMSIQELEALIVAEVLLIAFEIPVKFTELNASGNEEKHNALVKAASAVSMGLTKKDIKIMRDSNKIGISGLTLPQDAYCVEDIRLDTQLNAMEKMPLEYYYDLLLNHSDNPISLNGGSQGFNNSISNQNGKLNNNYNSKLPKMPNNKTNENSNVHKWENIAKKDAIHEQIKTTISNAYNSMSSKERGFISNEILDQIKIVMKPPKIKWQKILKDTLGTVRHGKLSTMRKPNRRQYERLDIPGVTKNYITKIVIGIDTSGSMSNEMIADALNEVFNIFKNYPTEVTIIECDYNISKTPYVAKKAKDVQTNISGRGGTRFTPVIEYINNNNYKDAVLVYFTDGYGEESIPKPKVYKTLWVLIDDSCKMSLSEPYGKVVYLDSDEKFNKYKIKGGLR